MRSSVNLSAVVALSLLGCTDAFWRMGCAVIQTGRIDPIVNPGTLAEHAHTIMGAANLGINSTFSSLLSSQCTSCEIAADKSAYWTPLLYYQYPNGSFIDVPHDGAVAYYLGRGPNRNNTVPFPKGFQILSGDKSARGPDYKTMTYGTPEYPGRPIMNRVSFACLAVGMSLQEQPWMFNTTCGNGLRAQIHFQSCWDGKNLYKTDNSHVAYQSGINNVCIF